MRLLNTATFEVKEFPNDVPKYAILSHTWDKDEVTFRDIQNLDVAKLKSGWSKVQNACAYVRRYRFQWIWIDTCCIDKSSSAELSEALNSMYKYYGEAHVCIAYLTDVSNEKNVTDLEELKGSRWFKRGWTLQELIAPRYMVFLDHDWNMIGTRFGMRHIVSEVTSVPVEVFETGQLEHYSIAQKMSWAASRGTTRSEDMAYCLMGLFGVNIPPIYGEGGEKAFMRLQQEIIKYSDDRSIFAWVTSDDYHRDRGLFASSPSEFALSGEVGRAESEDLGGKSLFSFGNSGLRIHLPLTSLPNIGEDIFVASLHCQDADGSIGIYLQKEGHRYIRWCPHFPLPRINKSSNRLQEIIVKESVVPRQWIEQDDYEIPIEFKIDSQLRKVDSSSRLIDDDDSSHYNSPQLVLSLHYSSEIFDLWTEKGERIRVAVLTFPKGIFLGAVAVRLAIDRPSIRYIPLQDSDLFSIDDENALVSCFIHATGDSSNQKIAEFNYIPPSSANFKLYRQIDRFRCSPRILRPTTLNFTVCIGFRPGWYYTGSVPTVFPSNFLWRKVGINAYGTLNAHEQRDLHVVFMYHLFNWRIEYLFITLGWRPEQERCIPWIDVFVSDDELSISDAWQSYHPSGSRYGRRQDGRTTAALDGGASLGVTVKEKSMCESVLYHVVIGKKDHEKSFESGRMGDQCTVL